MIGAAVLDALLAAGASAEMIVEAVKAANRETETHKAERRAKDAERQRRVRRARRARLDGDASHSIAVTPQDSADTPPDENKSNPPLPQSSDEDWPPAHGAVSIEHRVVAAWNGGAAPAGALPSRGLTARRRQSLKARMSEHGEAAVFEAIAHLAASPFHCGANDRGWRASLGWLLTSPENFQKMLELAPPPAALPPRMSATERAAAAERSAALFERMGRSDEAADMRRTAASLRTTNSQGET
ncbi:hypothetical protein [Sphingomonas crusticola]|uniref:hypothetical protein n=1 Tax=Sphingomonas crusticola TaxID=1697973 RepID=UPI0013C34F0D|nr:hypothetical protein [Sphingomonas crusticola]